MKNLLSSYGLSNSVNSTPSLISIFTVLLQDVFNTIRLKFSTTGGDGDPPVDRPAVSKVKVVVDNDLMDKFKVTITFTASNRHNLVLPIKLEFPNGRYHDVGGTRTESDGKVLFTESETDIPDYGVNTVSVKHVDDNPDSAVYNYIRNVQNSATT